MAIQLSELLVMCWFHFQVRSTGLHSSSEDDDPDFRDIAFPSDTAMQNVGTKHSPHFGSITYQLQSLYHGYMQFLLQ